MPAACVSRVITLSAQSFGPLLKGPCAAFQPQCSLSQKPARFNGLPLLCLMAFASNGQPRQRALSRDVPLVHHQRHLAHLAHSTLQTKHGFLYKEGEGKKSAKGGKEPKSGGETKNSLSPLVVHLRLCLQAQQVSKLQKRSRHLGAVAEICPFRQLARHHRRIWPFCTSQAWKPSHLCRKGT